jgi:hypothetical protein
VAFSEGVMKKKGREIRAPFCLAGFTLLPAEAQSGVNGMEVAFSTCALSGFRSRNIVFTTGSYLSSNRRIG